MVTTLERPPVHRNVHLVPIPTSKAANYIRVSGHRQEDGASLAVQLESCRHYCEVNGLEIVGEFKDVQSGLDIDRPEYQQALKLAKAKGFNQLVVYRYDRTGRDDAEFAGMLKDFAKLGIQLASATGESPDPFYQKLAGLLAWDESRRLSIRVTGAKMKRHSVGQWGGKPPFGYTTEKQPGGGSILVPVEEAPLVAEMFTLYAGVKHSLFDLRDFLNQAWVVKSRYSIWYILSNRAYTGMVMHGKNVKSQFHPKPEEPTWVEGLHQALVDPQTFEQVQIRLTENKSRQRGGPAAKYLFSGLVYCDNCGQRYQARTFKRRGDRFYIDYRCNRRHGFGDCPAPSILEGRIRKVVIPPIEKLLGQLSQAELRGAVRAELERQQGESAAADQVARTGLADRLHKLEARLTNWENLYGDGEMTRERFIQRRDEVSPQIAELRGQLDEKPASVLPQVDQLFAMADALKDEPPDEEEWREIIAAVVDRIIVEGSKEGSRKATATVRVRWREWFLPLLKTTAAGF